MPFISFIIKELKMNLNIASKHVVFINVYYLKYYKKNGGINPPKNILTSCVPSVTLQALIGYFPL